LRLRLPANAAEESFCAAVVTKCLQRGLDKPSAVRRSAVEFTFSVWPQQSLLALQ